MTDIARRWNLPYPLLMQFGYRACIFVTLSFVLDREKNVSDGSCPYLSINQLRSWVSEGMELALHSHSHPNYREVSVSQIESDLDKNLEVLALHRLPYEAAMKKMYARKGLKAAFRIGNRIHSWNRLTSKGFDPYEICRTNIRGTNLRTFFGSE